MSVHIYTIIYIFNFVWKCLVYPHNDEPVGKLGRPIGKAMLTCWASSFGNGTSPSMEVYN